VRSPWRRCCVGPGSSTPDPRRHRSTSAAASASRCTPAARFRIPGGRWWSCCWWRARSSAACCSPTCICGPCRRRSGRSPMLSPLPGIPLPPPCCLP
jgi:hypothetical protein